VKMMSAEEKETIWNKYTYKIPFYYAPNLVPLTQLNLGKNRLTEQDLKHLTSALPQCPTLTEVNLWGCELSDEQVTAISSVITNTHIKELNLGNNPKIKSTFLEHLESSKVTTLNLSWNDLGDEGAKNVASLLSTNKSITSLDLSAVNFKDDEIAILISALLGNNNTLQYLNIQNNQISAKSFRLLSQLLKTNRSLTYLSLRALYLGNEGVDLLSDGLLSNKTLLTLDLQNNNIDNSGLARIIIALPSTNLEHLHLEWNKISNPEDILTVVGKSRLLAVHLRGNSIKQEAIIKIEQQIAQLVTERNKK